jgi:hypothetical protein
MDRSARHPPEAIVAVSSEGEMKVHRLTGEKGEESSAVPVRKGVTDIAVQGTSRVSCRIASVDSFYVVIAPKFDRRERRGTFWSERGSAGLEGGLRVNDRSFLLTRRGVMHRCCQKGTLKVER